jgi:uncharacterized membrane protein
MWFLFSFLTATAAAGNDIFFSRQALKALPARVKAFAISVAAMPLLLIALSFSRIPTVHHSFWWIVTLHAALMAVAHILYMRALALGPLSQTQPILALTTVFLIFTNPLMTDDRLTTTGMIGVALVGIGIYATQHPGKDASGHVAGFLSPFIEMWRQPGVMSKLGVAIIFSVTANLDRLAISASSGPFYLAIDSMITAAFLGAVLLFQYVRKRSETGISGAAPMAIPFRQLAIGGSIHASSMIFHMTALTFASVPYVIAVKRLSILLTSLWDYFVRKGRAPHWYRLIGVMLVVGGVALILLKG